MVYPRDINTVGEVFFYMRVCNDNKSTPTVVHDIVHHIHRASGETPDVKGEILAVHTVTDVYPESVHWEGGFLEFLILAHHLNA